MKSVKTEKRAANEFHFTSLDFVNYHEYLPILHQLEKYLPASFSDIQGKNKTIANALESFPEFKRFVSSKKLPISKEFLISLEKELTKDRYEVEVEKDAASKSFIVGSEVTLSICASAKHLQLLQAFDQKNSYREQHSSLCMDLFTQLSFRSQKLGHPYKVDQLGWVTFLVTPKHSITITNLSSDFLDNYSLPEKQASDPNVVKAFNFILTTFGDFRHIALVASQKFARDNGIKNIIYAINSNNTSKQSIDKVLEKHLFKIKKNTDYYGDDTSFMIKEAKSKKSAANETHEFDMEHVDYHKLLPSVYELQKLVPISIEDLKKQHPSLANKLQASEDFKNLLGSKKALDKDDVQDLLESLDVDQHAIVKDNWNGAHMSQDKPGHQQLVLMVQADETTIEEMKEAGCYDLFEQVVQLSASSGHPSCENMLGFVRLDIAEDKSFMLVEEIQSDQLAAAARFKKFDADKELALIEKHMPHMRGHVTKEHMQAQHDQVIGMIPDLEELCSHFPEVAMVTIQQFAKKNGIKKIYYHTYDGGNKLKKYTDSAPPKSLYSSLPKSHYYKVTEEKPFGLPADFFVKEASLRLRIAHNLRKAKHILRNVK